MAKSCKKVHQLVAKSCRNYCELLAKSCIFVYNLLMLCLIEKYLQNWSNGDRKSKQELDFIFEEDGAITVL